MEDKFIFDDVMSRLKENPEEIEQKKSYYWLVSLVMAYNREGWEDSEPISKVIENVNDFLFNRGLQPDFSDHSENVNSLLEVVGHIDRF